jgi:hypothetical protein
LVVADRGTPEKETDEHKPREEEVESANPLERPQRRFHFSTVIIAIF